MLDLIYSELQERRGYLGGHKDRNMVEIRENVEEFEDNEKIELLSALMDASMT